MYEGIYLNMDTPLVSVIVPVYNAENTLHACVLPAFCFVDN